MRFRDRTHAGRELAIRVQELGLADPIVLALPRGGVPVAFEVAAALHAPFDVLVARKVGAPGHEELGVGAIAEGSDELVLGPAAEELGIGRREMDRQVDREREELSRRVAHYRGGRGLPDVTGRNVVIVDDGLATGVTAEAALRALATGRPRRLVLATPVCAAATAHRLRDLADDVSCLMAPEDFLAVGAWYENFAQTSDDEVLELLDQAKGGAPSRR